VTWGSNTGEDVHIEMIVAKMAIQVNVLSIKKSYECRRYHTWNKDEADFTKVSQKLKHELEHVVAITKKAIRPNPSNQYEMPHISQANTALNHLLSGRVFGLL